MKTYGERLDVALSRSGKDRAQLSQGIGVSVQAIGQVIAGKTKALTAENSARAAKFLGVDHYWLATGEGDIGSSSANQEWPFVGLSKTEWQSIPKEDQEEVISLAKMKAARYQKSKNVA